MNAKYDMIVDVVRSRPYDSLKAIADDLGFDEGVVYRAVKGRVDVSKRIPVRKQRRVHGESINMTTWLHTGDVLMSQQKQKCQSASPAKPRCHGWASTARPAHCRCPRPA